MTRHEAKIANSIFGLAAGLGLLSLGLCSATAQPVRTTYTPAELEQYHQDRLLRIEYTVQEKSTGNEKTIRGTGFLISGDGWALTARHVLGPAMGDENERYVQISPIIVINDTGGFPRRFAIVPKLTRLSNFGDVASFKISTDSDSLNVKYFCVSRDESRLVAGSEVTMSAWRYYEGIDPPWKAFYHPSEKIGQPNGPGRLSEYLALSQPIEKSMSGGAILQNGLVVAVISRSLNDNGQVTADGNYAYFLKYAKDSAWDGRADQCERLIDDEVDLVPQGKQENFSLSTCEGSVGWMREGTVTEFFSFPDSGNYRMRRRELVCDSKVCGKCSGKRKSVRLVINHVYSLPPPAECELEAAPENLRGQLLTFGVQVVPIFKNSVRFNTAEAWFYRNVDLFRRNAAGQFNTKTVGSSPAYSPITSDKFNEITRNSDPARLKQERKCTNMSDQECADVSALEAFDQSVGIRMQWHGYVRPEDGAKSTLSGITAREGWAVPDDLVAAQKLLVKNWILRYVLTDNKSSTSPVDFAFCVDPDWDQFVVRRFSTERNIRPNVIRVFLED